MRNRVAEWTAAAVVVVGIAALAWPRSAIAESDLADMRGGGHYICETEQNRTCTQALNQYCGTTVKNCTGCGPGAQNQRCTVGTCSAPEKRVSICVLSPGESCEVWPALTCGTAIVSQCPNDSQASKTLTPDPHCGGGTGYICVNLACNPSGGTDEPCNPIVCRE